MRSMTSTTQADRRSVDSFPIELPEFLSAGRTLRSSRPFAHFVTVPYRHASKAERTDRTAVESTRASLLQAGFPDTWWAVCMIYFVAMWNGHMRGRDGFTPYQCRHGEDAPYRMYPWGSLASSSLKMRKRATGGARS